MIEAEVEKALNAERVVEMSERPSRPLHIATGIIAGLSFGTASITIRLLGDLSASKIALWRLFFGCAAIAFLSIVRKRIGLTVPPHGKRARVCLMGLILGFHFLVFVQSVKDTSILASTVLVNTAPIQSLVMGRLFFGVRIGASDVIIATLGFSGSFMMATSHARVAGGLLGDLEAFVAGSLIAIYSNLAVDLRRDERVDPVSVMSSIYGLASLTLAAFSLLRGLEIWIPLESRAIALLLALGLIPTGIGHTLLVFSLKELKPHEAGLMALLEPVSATIIALLLLREYPAGLSLVGASMVLASVALVSLQKS